MYESRIELMRIKSDKTDSLKALQDPSRKSLLPLAAPPAIAVSFLPTGIIHHQRPVSMPEDIIPCSSIPTLVGLSSGWLNYEW